MKRLVAVLVLALVFPAGALAHATLEDAAPRSGQRLEQPPRTIVLRFSGPVGALRGSIQVLDAAGKIVSLPARVVDRNALVAPLRPLAKGPYTVRWRTLSVNDGHVVSGVQTFGVRYPAPPVTSAVGATGPTAAEDRPMASPSRRPQSASRQRTWKSPFGNNGCGLKLSRDCHVG